MRQAVYMCLLPLVTAWPRRADATTVSNAGVDCHEKCGWSGPTGLNRQHDGHCPSDFCGAGACCKKGLISSPCNGTMGCDGRQCCVRVPQLPLPPPSAAAAVVLTARSREPPTPPPPLPPLSECSIERIQYEVLRSSHDHVGDKMYQVALHVEPWRLGSIVYLTYRQTGLATGRERAIKVKMILRGAMSNAWSGATERSAVV